MFCEKCGAKNDNNAKFCEGCGTALETAETVLESAKGFKTPEKESFVAPDLSDGSKTVSSNNFSEKTKTPMSLKNKIIIIVVAVLVVLCGLLYYLGKVVTDPKKIVERYFESITSNNYAEAYECMDIESGEFTTKDMFVKVMENLNEEDKKSVTNYTVKENINQNPLMKSYEITYTQKGRNDIYSMDITLMKQASKKWLFYDDYKVAENGLIAKQYSVTVPDGTELYIDDIKVDEKYVSDDNEASVGIKEKNYIIPEIFVGNHEFKVTASFIKDKVFDYMIYDEGYVYVDYVELSDESIKEVSVLAEEFVNKFVTSAITKKPMDSINTYLAKNVDISSIKYIYDELMERGLNEEGVGVKTINFTEFETEAQEYYGSGTSYYASVDFEYNYTALSKNWYDDTIEEYTPDYPQNGYATVYFVYEDGKWMVSDIYISIYMYY